VVAAGNTVAIDAVRIQIAVEIGTAVEAAAGARPKKVMTEDHETTAKKVIITTVAVAVTVTVAAAALAWNIKATEPIDRLISSTTTQSRMC